LLVEVVEVGRIIVVVEVQVGFVLAQDYLLPQRILTPLQLVLVVLVAQRILVELMEYQEVIHPLLVRL
jgi:hypothetical protein